LIIWAAPGKSKDFVEILPLIISRSKQFMAILDILRYPDPRLYTIAQPVEKVDDSVRRLVRDMAETMYAAPGIGLAATQVDVHKRVIVIDVSDARDQLVVLINPEIVWREGEKECEEGCLSVPGVYDIVKRAERVGVRALDADGRQFELTAEGLLAVCVQHEIDHLEGKVFVEYLSRLKQTRIRARLQKQQRKTA
jgi:peptide deformylase